MESGSADGLTVANNKLIPHSAHDTGMTALIGASSNAAVDLWDTSAADSLSGSTGADKFHLSGGNDRVDGSDGSDTVVYNRRSQEYNITKNSDGSFTVTHAGGSSGVSHGIDTLVNVEKIQFLDKLVDLSQTGGKKDIIFLQDLSDSFSDDLPNVQRSIDEILGTLRSKFSDVDFSVATLIDGGAYVPTVASTKDGTAIINAYAGFSAAGNEQEAVLGALVNAANGTGLNLQGGSSQKIVLVITDEGYRDNRSPDRTSVQMVVNALEAQNAVPIFAVTSGVFSTYEDLVQKLGRGVVVTITSNADNFADAIRAAASSVAGEVTQMGDDGNNNLIGSDTGRDGLFGGLGNDRINGKGGHDIVDGGAGNDVLYGGAGDDTVNGGTGNDILYGDAPSSTMTGSAISAFGQASQAIAAAASRLDGAYSLTQDTDIIDSTTVPHVTVQGVGSGIIDYYYVTLIPGATITLDIDTANLGGRSFDSVVELFNPTGARIGYNDDASTSDGAGGSTSSNDSFLSMSVAASGTYTIAVKGYGGSGAVPLGAIYKLHVSVDGVFGIGGTGVTGSDVIDGGDGADVAVFQDSRSNYEINGSRIDGQGQSDFVTNVEKIIFDDYELDVSRARGANEGEKDIARFFNASSGSHFYTANAQERDSLIQSGALTYEGNVFDSNATISDGTAVHRFYNNSTGTHFYTMSALERDVILQTLPSFRYEGEAFYAYAEAGAGREALYRFYNTLNGTHFYTASEEERDSVMASLRHYQYEGTAFWVDIA